MRDMRTARGLVATGIVAGLLVVATPCAPTAWASGTKSPQVSTHKAMKPYRCELKLRSGRPLGPAHESSGYAADAADDTRSAPRHPSPAVGGGNVAVVIPAVAFIRAHGARWVVTTNTGAPPNASETFYYLSHGKAGVVGPTVRSVVLARCTTHDHH